MRLALQRDSTGDLLIVDVTISDVHPARLASMRANGQNDCGKRQHLNPVLNQKTGDIYLFPGTREGVAEAESVMDELVAFERSQGRRAEKVDIDKNIPAM